MTQSSDFEQEQIPSESKSSVPIALWIFGGLGCGCFGIILIGILAAIALPSFLNQANKAREAEARQNIGSLTRAQQAYHLEKGKFSPAIEDLELGIQPESDNYRYQIVPQPDNETVMITAQAKSPTLKSYTGAVFAIKKGEDVSTVTEICETETPTTTPPSLPTLIDEKVVSVECPPGSNALN